MSQIITLPDDRIEIVGALSVDPSSDGLVFRRLPAHVRHQVPPEADFIAQSPSGVRLRFVTDASMIGLRCLPTILQFDDDEPWPAAIDLVVDGEVVDTASTDHGTRIRLSWTDRAFFDVTHGDGVTIALTAAASGPRVVEVWLPNNALGSFSAVVLPDSATLAAAPPDDRRRWVHHGSSISHCLEATSPMGTWPAVAARLAGVHLTNLGLAGQCHLDQFAARTIRDLPADVISLKLGINVLNGDTLRMRTFAPAVHGFLDTVRDGHPDTPIVLVSPIICPTGEDRPGPTLMGSFGKFEAMGTDDAKLAGALTLQQMRAIEAGIVETRRDLGDTNLHYLSGLELFGPDDVDDLPDGLHPNAAGYRRMGERFADLAFGSDGPFFSVTRGIT